VVEPDHSDEHAHTRSSAHQLAASVDPEGWGVEVAETRERRETHPYAHEPTFRNAVLRASKRS
jgi:hypothetical protein